MRQKLIILIISILFMIWHYKHITLIGIHDIHVLLLQEKLFLPLSMFIHQNRQIWILVLVSIIFMIRYHEHIFLIRILDIDALILLEKLFFPPFSIVLKFIHRKRQTWILVIISIIFMNQHYKHVFFIGIQNIDALVLEEIFSFCCFPYNQSSSEK